MPIDGTPLIEMLLAAMGLEDEMAERDQIKRRYWLLEALPPDRTVEASIWGRTVVGES